MFKPFWNVYLGVVQLDIFNRKTLSFQICYCGVQKANRTISPYAIDWVIVHLVAISVTSRESSGMSRAVLRPWSVRPAVNKIATNSPISAKPPEITSFVILWRCVLRAFHLGCVLHFFTQEALFDLLSDLSE